MGSSVQPGRDSRMRTPAENIGVSERAVRAIGDLDLDGLVGSSHPRVELIAPACAIECDSYRGHAGLSAFLDDLRKVWEFWRPEPRGTDADGDAVLLSGMTHARGRSSGVDLRLPWAQVFRLRESKIYWTTIYADVLEAEAAMARLRPS